MHGMELTCFITGNKPFKGLLWADKRVLIPLIFKVTGEASTTWILTVLCDAVHNKK